DIEKEKLWPRVEMRAPFDGVIVEKSVNIHNFVDTSTDLFKIAKLDKLMVYANAYEEDLPALLALKAEQRRWQIHLQNEPNAKPYYRQGRVVVTRREREVVFLSTVRKPGPSRKGTAEQAASQREFPLQPGKTWVVSSGSVELKAALEDLQSGQAKR